MCMLIIETSSNLNRSKSGFCKRIDDCIRGETFLKCSISWNNYIAHIIVEGRLNLSIFSLKRSHKRFIKGMYNIGTNMYLIEAHYEQCCRIYTWRMRIEEQNSSLSFPPKTCECTFCTKRTKDEVQIKNPSFDIHLNRQLCISLPQNSFPFRDNEERSLLMSTWTNAAF